MGEDGLTVSGGAGGVSAHYADMVSYASVIDTAGDDLREVSGRLAALVTDGDILEAAVLCPAEVAEVEAALALAATGPSGALWASGEMEVSARFLRTSVAAWRELDEQLGRAEEAFWTTAGWGAGAVLPAGGLATAGLSASNPALAALLYANRDDLGAGAQETLYDNPWLMEAITRSAPGLVQGASFSLSHWLPGGTVGLAVLTDGQWPTGDYTSSVAGLVAIANRFGHLEDTGEFHVEAVAGSVAPAALPREHAVRDIFVQLGELGRQDAEVQIIEIGQPPRYVVQIPGTQDWSSQRGDNPVDLPSNVNLMAGEDQTVIEEQVLDAMRAHGIDPDAEVMLTGHSQGGITAMSIASDPAVVAEFTISSVVTAGSPVGRIEVPAEVSVLALEHEQDAVPMLDAADNPDRPNWTTVRRELSDVEGTLDGVRGPGAAHSTDNYAQTGAQVDASSDASIERWRSENEQFFGQGRRARYAIRAGEE